MNEPSASPGSDLSRGLHLDSWKEIAAYLKRDIRTVQRWEKQEGLPVHRHQHDERATTYAYSGEIDRWLAAGTTVVLACSALKQSYRDVLAKGRPKVRFVYLKGEESLLRARLERRRGHYMPASLLASQIAALEAPAHAITVDVAGSPEAIVSEIRAKLPGAPGSGG